MTEWRPSPRHNFLKLCGKIQNVTGWRPSHRHNSKSGCDGHHNFSFCYNYANFHFLFLCLGVVCNSLNLKLDALINFGEKPKYHDEKNIFVWILWRPSQLQVWRPSHPFLTVTAVTAILKLNFLMEPIFKTWWPYHHSTPNLL